MNFKTSIRENVNVNIRSFIIKNMKYTEKELNTYLNTRDYELHSQYAMDEWFYQIYLQKYGDDTTTFNAKIEIVYKYYEQRFAVDRYNFYLYEVLPYLKYLHNILHDIFYNEQVCLK